MADQDAGNLTVTLTATNGTLTMTTLTGLTFSAGDGTADTTMTFSGTQTAINTALGTLSYANTADYNGAASLTFTTNDGVASPVVKTVSLSVTPVADIVADSVTTNEDTAIVFNAITGTNGASADSFEGSPSVTAVTQGTKGGVTFAANGTLTYTPNLNQTGSDSFTYTVTSGGVTETATETVTITAVNDAPTATNLNAAETYTEDQAPLRPGRHRHRRRRHGQPHRHPHAVRPGGGLPLDGHRGIDHVDLCHRLRAVDRFRPHRRGQHLAGGRDLHADPQLQRRFHHRHERERRGRPRSHRLQDGDRRAGQ